VGLLCGRKGSPEIEPLTERRGRKRREEKRYGPHVRKRGKRKAED